MTHVTRQLRLLVLLLVVCGTLDSLFAQQQDCLPRVALPRPTEPNVFTGELESHLGDAVAEHIQKDYHIIEDTDVTSYLNHIGDRLIKNLPITELRFQFFLVDLPYPNAFVLPGGRIYVSRKLVALAQSEDELAGVIAHELGHLVTHESAIEVTRQLREVINVTTIGDRRDVFEKYNQLIDNYRRKPEAFKRGNRETGQLGADQVGMYALLNAGYDPASFARIWERLTEVKGKTGSWFSDLFGTTKPEERRLREMLKVVRALPAGCLQKSLAATNESFKRWQASVISYTGLGRRESIHGVLSRVELSPPLRSDITHIRFSPNGIYILAQDDSGINVLTREPFGPLFRIEAPDAKAAIFTPDSQNIVFSTDNLRIEKWSVAQEKMVTAKEVVVLKGCIQTELSPDGTMLACLNTRFDLNVLDVASGETIIQRKEFFRPTYFPLFLFRAALAARRFENGDAQLELVNMAFSPNAKYFVAGYEDGVNDVEGFDLTSMRKISLPGSIERLIAGGFSFMGSDRLVGVNLNNYKKSALVSFPGGELIAELPLRGHIESPTRGEFVLVRPVVNYAVGVMDLKTKVIFKSSKQPALDIFDDLFVAEMRNGELGLYKMEKNQIVATTLLSNSNLGRIRVGELSDDLKWLAVSGRSRGGVWSLENGEAVLYLRGFRGAHISSEDRYFFGDFPKYESPDGNIADRNVARFSLATNEIKPGPKIEDDSARQAGTYLVVVKPAKGDAKDDFRRYAHNVVVQILDARSMTPLWSKTYPDEAPQTWISHQHNTVTLIWNVTDDAAKAAIKGDAQLSKQLAALKETEGDYLAEVLDIRNGNSLGKLLIETGKGSFRLGPVFAAEGWVIVTDTNNRVSVYSLKTGELRGRVFGNIAAIAPKNHLLCVENETGKLAIYNLETMEKRDEFTFTSALAMLRFSPDNNRLFVLTTNQVAYIFDVKQLRNTAAQN